MRRTIDRWKQAICVRLRQKLEPAASGASEACRVVRLDASLQRRIGASRS